MRNERRIEMGLPGSAILQAGMEKTMRRKHPRSFKRLAVILSFLGCFSLLLFPQEKLVTIQRIDISRLPEIRIYLTVTDEKGESVPGLTGKELEVSIDDAVQPIVSLTSAFEGGVYLAVALLFDRSGSMKNAIDKTKEAGMAFLKRMSEKDLIAIVTFDHRVQVDSNFTVNRAESERAIKQIALGGDTALYDAIHEALALFEKAGTPRQAVVVLSDGKDTRSHLERKAVLDEAKKKGVPVFAVNLDAAGDKNNLEDLARQTGGNYFEAATPNDLLFLYRVIADQLNNQYVLAVHSDSGLDEQFHGLKITLKDPAGASVSVQREYIASKGPGVKRDTVTGLQKQVETRSAALVLGIGAVLGFLMGLVILLLIKIMRPDIRIFSLISLALVLSSLILGGILGAFYYFLL